jgi:hypothetical protein
LVQTFGGEDPISGTAAILEVAKSLASIYQKGLISNAIKAVDCCGAERN